MYALAVYYRLRGNHSITSAQRSFLAHCSKSDSRSMRRRSMHVILDQGHKDILRIIPKALASEEWNEDEKVMLLQHVAHSRAATVPTCTEELIQFLASLKSHRNIATILEASPKLNWDVAEALIVPLLANDHSLLDEVHAPIVYEYWNGERTDQKIQSSSINQPLFEIIVDLIDQRSRKGQVEGFMRQSIGPRMVVIDEQLGDAIKTLENRKSKSTGAAKRKLERVLAQLKPREHGWPTGK